MSHSINEGVESNYLAGSKPVVDFEFTQGDISRRTSSSSKLIDFRKQVQRPSTDLFNKDHLKRIAQQLPEDVIAGKQLTEKQTRIAAKLKEAKMSLGKPYSSKMVIPKMVREIPVFQGPRPTSKPEKQFFDLTKRRKTATCSAEKRRRQKKVILYLDDDISVSGDSFIFPKDDESLENEEIVNIQSVQKVSKRGSVQHVCSHDNTDLPLEQKAQEEPKTSEVLFAPETLVNYNSSYFVCEPEIKASARFRPKRSLAQSVTHLKAFRKQEPNQLPHPFFSTRTQSALNNKRSTETIKAILPQQIALNTKLNKQNFNFNERFISGYSLSKLKSSGKVDLPVIKDLPKITHTMRLFPKPEISRELQEETANEESETPFSHAFTATEAALSPRKIGQFEASVTVDFTDFGQYTSSRPQRRRKVVKKHNEPQVCCRKSVDVVMNRLHCGFLSSKIEIQNTIGNANNVNPQLLKPRYAAHCEFGKVVDEEGNIYKPVPVVLNTNQSLKKQVPLLISSFRYLSHTVFEEPMPDLVLDIEPFLQEYVYLTGEKAHENILRKHKSHRYLQVLIRKKFLTRGASFKNCSEISFQLLVFDNSKVSLEKLLDFVWLSDPTLAIWVEKKLFEPRVTRDYTEEEFDEAANKPVCPLEPPKRKGREATVEEILDFTQFEEKWISDELQRLRKVFNQGRDRRWLQEFRNHGDVCWVNEVNSCFLFKTQMAGLLYPSAEVERFDSQIRQAFQFNIFFVKWVTEFVVSHKEIEQKYDAEFKKQDEVLNQMELCVKNKLAWLEFLPVRKFHFNCSDRGVRYQRAAQKIKELEGLLQEFDIKTPDFERVLNHTNYDELKRVNDEFDRESAINEDSEPLFKSFQKNFQKQLQGQFAHLEPSCVTRRKITPFEKRDLFLNANVPLLKSCPTNFVRSFKWRSTGYKTDSQTQKLFQSYNDRVFKNFPYNYRNGSMDYDPVRPLPEIAKKNHLITSTWNESLYAENYMSYSEIQRRLYNFDVFWVFGGESTDPRSLFQLYEPESKATGKLRLRFLWEIQTKLQEKLKKKTFIPPKIGGKQEMTLSEIEQVRGFTKQVVLFDSQMESDLFAMSFCKEEFVPREENEPFYPRFERIAIYNSELRQNEEPVWLQKHFYRDHAMNIYFQQYHKILEQHKLRYQARVMAQVSRKVKLRTTVRKQFKKEAKNKVLEQFRVKKVKTESPTSLLEVVPFVQKRNSCQNLDLAVLELQIPSAEQEAYLITESSSDEDLPKQKQISAEDQAKQEELVQKMRQGMLKDFKSKLVFKPVIEEDVDIESLNTPVNYSRKTPLYRKLDDVDILFQDRAQTKQKNPTYSEFLDVSQYVQSITNNLETGSYSSSASEFDTGSLSSETQQQSPISGYEKPDFVASKYRRIEDPVHPYIFAEHFKESQLGRKETERRKLDFSRLLDHPEKVKYDGLNYWLDAGAEMGIQPEKVEFEMLLGDENIFPDADNFCDDIQENSQSTESITSASFVSEEDSQKKVTMRELFNIQQQKAINSQRRLTVAINLGSCDFHQLIGQAGKYKRSTTLASKVHRNTVLSRETLSDVENNNLQQMLEDIMKEASSPGLKSKKLLKYSAYQYEERASEIFENEVKNSFFQAVASEDKSLVQNYVERFSLNLEMQDALGNTALNMATQVRSRAMLELLLKMGASPCTPNQIGKSAKDYAPELFD